MPYVEEIGRPSSPLGRNIKYYLLLAAVVVFVALMFGIATTAVSRVEPGEAAVKLNNVTGSQTVITKVGYQFHLPFGMTRFYKFDTEDRTLQMSGRDAIRVKTRDGSNVDVDVALKFRVMRQDESLQALANSFGSDRDLTQVTQLIRSFARSIVRESLGELQIHEVTEGLQRQQKSLEVADKMNASLRDYGISIDTVSIPKPTLSPQYQALIDERKDADNVLINQASAQEEARQRQAQQVAEKTREKNTAIEEEKGRQEKRLIEARGQARQKMARSDGEAQRIRIQGDQKYQIALNDAKAIEAEGIARAKGIQKLADAYSLGGLSLVREALAAKYQGRTINGRPYTVSEDVERLSIEYSNDRNATAAAGAQQTGGQ